MFRFACVIALLVTSYAVPADSPYTEGQHYERVQPAVATQSDHKIEVVEVFWYGCHHCYAFEPHIRKWLETKPDSVEFRRVPGIFQRSWVAHARAYFTAELLGVVDTIHDPLFEALHEQRRKIGDEESLARFFAEHGVADEDFREAYNSYSVDTKTRQAMIATKDYGITGVPAVIVNGRFRTSARLAGSYENLLKVVDALVDKESER